MEVRNKTPQTPIKAILFDFDGTISTLRCGWEEVMAPLFLQILQDGKTPNDQLCAKIDKFIDESTGIQTILQMKWLQAEVLASGREALDIWQYKKMYNDRLMQNVQAKIAALQSGNACPSQYLVPGAVEFLQALKQKGIKILVASGTDDPDVKKEAKVLGVDVFFDEIHGAPLGQEGCSKEAVIHSMLSQGGYCGEQFAVCGDGKVEIALGKQAQARAIGVASNEKSKIGADPAKYARLTKANADVIVADFTQKDQLLAFLGLHN